MHFWLLIFGAKLCVCLIRNTCTPPPDPYCVRIFSLLQHCQNNTDNLQIIPTTCKTMPTSLQLFLLELVYPFFDLKFYLIKENLCKRKFWVFSRKNCSYEKKFMNKNPLFLPSFGQKFGHFCWFLSTIFSNQQSANQQSDLPFVDMTKNSFGEVNKLKIIKIFY